MNTLLQISNLHVSVEDKEVLRGITLTIRPGEVHVIMGPNGSGKSSLALTLMGHPSYRVERGSIQFNGHDITAMKPHKRARLGLFLSFQNPVAVPGISVANLTRTAYKTIHTGEKVNIKVFRAQITNTLATLHREPTFLDRSVNDGFSGGEKKMSEVLQFATLLPKLAIFDEVDSGLDIDSLKRIAEVINAHKSPERSLLIITHYQRILNYIQPDHVHILSGGTIVRSGGKEIAPELEKTGYDHVQDSQTSADPSGSTSSPFGMTNT